MLLIVNINKYFTFPGFFTREGQIFCSKSIGVTKNLKNLKNFNNKQC